MNIRTKKHLRLAQLMFRNSLVVFCYHDVTECPSQFSKKYGLNVRPSLFELQLNFISEYFDIISPIQLVSGDYRTPCALITFDDGLRSYFDIAVPLLGRKGIPSIIFLNMGPVGGEVFWSGLITYLISVDNGFRKHINDFSSDDDRELLLRCDRKVVREYLENHPNKDDLIKGAREFYGEFATVADLFRVAESRLVFFGNHLFNHYNVLNMSDDEIETEYTANGKKLSEFPNYVPFFSYPFGQPETCFDAHHTKLIYNLGAQAVFCSSGGVNNKEQTKLYDRVGASERIRSIWHLSFLVFRRKLLGFLKVIRRRIFYHGLG